MLTLRKHNFYYLLAGLLFLLVALPLIRDLTGPHYSFVTELSFSVFFIISIWSLPGTKGWFLSGIVLMILGISSNFLAIAGAGYFFNYLFLISYIIFLLSIISLAIRQVVSSGPINTNRVIGAICIYLLLGLIWALFYLFLNMTIPGSFSTQIDGAPFQQVHHFMYYSFVTLTTLGYGDILPIRETARALSTIETIFGQFYIAILVGGVVATFIARKNQLQ
jgi:voltage-gated potassium channel